jgi:dsDNA-specific endonuclease/ATPase MutS2
MNEGALSRLELPEVRRLLADRTAFAPGRELAEALFPTTDLREAERLQEETAAARVLLRASPSSGLRGARDIRDPVRRARLGGALDPAQLIAVADTVRAAEHLFADVHPHPPLAARARFAPTSARLRLVFSNASMGSSARPTCSACCRTRSSPSVAAATSCP